MSELTEIKDIYFIIHPAFSVAENRKDRRRTRTEVKDFFLEGIFPILQTAKKSGALVVIVPSPTLYLREWIGKQKERDGKNPNGLSAKRIRRAEGIEKSLIRRVVRAIGENKTIVLPQVNNETEVAAVLEKALSLKKLTLTRSVTIHGYGSYRKECVRDCIQEVHRAMKLRGRPRLSGKGTLSEKKMPKKRQNIRRI